MAFAEITRDLGKFIASARYGDLPARAIETAKLGISDCIAALIAGRNEPSTRLLADVTPMTSGSSTLLFAGHRVAPSHAALINGVSAHCLELDDVALMGHPSTTFVPAILAEAEDIGATGRDMILAYATAYELWAELIDRESGKHGDRGWHATGWIGPLAAAAGCASLRRLTADKAIIALGIAASQASGLAANIGTMTKPLHAGPSGDAWSHGREAGGRRL